MLRLERISVAYGKHEALHDVTLDVAVGRTTVILGANGAGKTTLLKTIAGLVRPQPGGRILFEDRPIEHEAPHKIVAAGIALVPEGRRLFGEMTVIDNLRMGAYTGRARTTENMQLEKQFALFPRLAERRDQLAKTMSGGEQQMLAIARALDVGTENPAARRALARPGAAADQGIVRRPAHDHERRAIGGAGRAERPSEPATRRPCLCAGKRPRAFVRHAGGNPRRRGDPAGLSGSEGRPVDRTRGCGCRPGCAGTAEIPSGRIC